MKGKFFFIFISFVMLVASCSRENVDFKSKFLITNFDKSREFKVKPDQNGIISFDARGFEYKNDFGIFNLIDSNRQVSIVIPIKNNSVNRYEISRTGIYPLVYSDKENEKIGVNFSGNDYLSLYQRLLESSIKLNRKEKIEPENAFQSLKEFAKKTNNSQLAGFLLFSGYQQYRDTEPSLGRKIKSFCCGKKGQFYELVCNGRSFEEKVKSGECQKHDEDTLVFQLAKSTILAESPVGKEIVVLTFWATWCGPCKPTLHKINDLSKKYYGNKAVIFIAISIDEELKKTLSYVNEHPEYFSHQSFLMDNGCMKLNYGIESIPRTFIFNKSGKLVTKNPEISALGNILDSLLILE